MRLEEIKLENYRQHKDLSLNFSRKLGEKDLHIIVADNTFGKTNILNAISWCFYGQEPHLQNESLAVSRINTSVVNETRLAGGGKIKVSVQLTFREDNGDRLTFKREETYNVSNTACVAIGSGIHFSMPGPGGVESVEDKDTFDAKVTEFVPQEIHEFIFFDAERLKNFFGSQMQKNVKTGIYNFTQANVLDKAARAFKDYLNDEIEPQISKSGDTDVDKAQRAKKAAEKARDKQQETVDGILHSIRIAEEEIARLNGIIGNHENIGEKEKKRQSLAVEIKEKETELKECNQRLMVLCRSLYVFTRLFPSVKNYLRFIRDAETNNGKTVAVDREELKKYIDNRHCDVCNTDLTESALSYIQHIIDQNTISARLSSQMQIDKNSIMSAFHTYKDDLDEFHKKNDKADELSLKIEELLNEKAEIDDFLAHVPDTETIKESISQRKEFEQSRNTELQKLGIEKQQLEKLEKALSDAEKDYNLVLAKHKNLSELLEDKRVCDNARKALEQISKEVLKECREVMQQKTYDIFCKIMTRKGRYNSFEIEEDYNVKLYDNLGNQTLGSCSAGETNILAYSFTLALQQVTGKDSLLFIDTPLGRIDVKNRENIINHLVNIADDKQVILLFTPSEYTENAANIIAGRYSSYNNYTSNE